MKQKITLLIVFSMMLLIISCDKEKDNKGLLLLLLGSSGSSGTSDSCGAEADSVASDSAALSSSTFTFAAGDSASWVTQNFTMPTSGACGSTITWTSSNEAVLAVTGGDAAVTRPSSTLGDDPFIYLTAAISKGSTNDAKDIAVTIKRKYWVQDAYLKASNAEHFELFGERVAVSGDTIVVGCWGEDSNQTTITNTDGSASDDNSVEASGAAYVYKKDASGDWIQDAYLKASNPNERDGFGYSVAVSGGTIVVGAVGEDSNQTTITNADGSASDDNSVPDSGAAYVFKEDAEGKWTQDAYLKASNPDEEDYFGASVSVSGDIIVVGAYCEDSNKTTITNTNGRASADNSAANSGAAYVFRKDASGKWGQDAYFKASNAEESDLFGKSVSVSGDIIVVGAELERSNQTIITNTDGSASANNSEHFSGAAYVFKKDASGNWIQDAYLKASNAEAEDCFGISVSVSGDTIVVGAYDEESGQTSITNSDGSASADNSASDSGAAYVFKKNASGDWVQDAYLKATNAEEEDIFGISVSVSGDTIVVGAFHEDGGQGSIINSDGSASADNSASDSGAAYVFKKNASGDWIQDAYFKASNARSGDNFGYSVSVSGDTVVVGSRYEKSSQTSITDTDGVASPNNSAPNAGAAYVFTVK